jgi:hypothetical protein
MSTNYQILYWRDIPAQVKLRSGRQRLAQPLPARFQEAIDEAAMRARTTGTDDYLNEWRASEWQSRDQDPEPLAQLLLQEIEQDYPAERLETLIANKGIDRQPESE